MSQKISNEDSHRLLPIFRKRRLACISCPTPCNPLPSVIDLTKTCPLPVPRWEKIEEKMGLGDLVEILAKPVARILKLDCLDDQGKLKPESGCAKRRDGLNRLTK
jgi:hypothetical protein